MQETSSFGALNYSICLIYIAVMFGIGLSFARKQKTTEEYFLAGRRMPWFIVAISMYASLASASSYMALPRRCSAFPHLIILPLLSETQCDHILRICRPPLRTAGKIHRFRSICLCALKLAGCCHLFTGTRSLRSY